MKIQLVILLTATLTIFSCKQKVTKNIGSEFLVSEKPPMGWNSWDCFGTSVTELEVKANANYMADRLKKYGWEYIIIDIDWYGPHLSASDTSELFYKRPKPHQLIDNYGRLIPAANKFPSCDQGSFKPLADWIHAKGLKFGLHIMRGIPWQAVENNSLIEGTNYHASDIVKLEDGCNWYDGMRGIDFTKPGSQEYYNSLFHQYAAWGVDFVKVDDMSAPTYHADDIYAIRKAIESCGRPIVLSLSPGSTPFVNRAHVQKYANMFRISEDFWDTWPQLKNQFALCKKWSLYQQKNHWADLDMLPLGKISIRAESGNARKTNFTKQEQITMMTMWAIFKSPLMFGGNLPENDAWTDSLITNEEVIYVNQNATKVKTVIQSTIVGNSILDANNNIPIWSSESKDGKTKYIAVFNLTDIPQKMSVIFREIQTNKTSFVRDLWERKDIGFFTEKFEKIVAPHGAALFSIKN